MEKENFDEELKNRIKQIFEEYDDGAADESWNRLREKFPEKKRHDYFFWWFAAAAVLLLGILLFWFSSSNTFNKSSKMVQRQPKEAGSKLQKADSVYQNKAFKGDLASTKTLIGSKATSSPNTKKIQVKTVWPIMAQRLQVRSQPKKTEQLTIEPKNQLKNQARFQTPTVFTGIKKVSADSAAKTAQTKKAEPIVIAEKTQAETMVQKVATPLLVKADSFRKNGQEITSKNPAANQLVLTDSLIKKQPQFIAKAANLIAKKPVIVKKAEPAEKLLKEKPSKFSLGLYAGTHLNYASGSNNQLGLGAGISTDFRVAKNLKLSTGLGLLQNNLSYGQNIPASSKVAANNYAAASAAQTSIPGTQTNSLKSMDASLLALDIPVNLTYIVLPGKNSISFSAGFSSNTFVREVYDYQYNTAYTTSNSGTISVSNGSTQNLQSSKHFSNFNFANTLNLSAGFAYPLGKNKLQIEPFLKYPLGGNGSQQLIFGSAGVNLKMNLSTFKK